MPLTTDNTLDFWQERYQNRQTPWDRGETNPALLQWLKDEVISPPADVLIPGCGRGHEVVELARRGFAVTGVDLSIQALDELKPKLDRETPSATLIDANLLEWKPNRNFDVVYEQTCLCALLPRYWSAYEARLREWLKPGGVLLALFMQSDKFDGPPFHCALPDMRDLFDDTRWEWSGRPPLHVPHPEKVFEYAVILKRPA